jgi:hypothetical protein
MRFQHIKNLIEDINKITKHNRGKDSVAKRIAYEILEKKISSYKNIADYLYIGESLRMIFMARKEESFKLMVEGWNKNSLKQFKISCEPYGLGDVLIKIERIADNPEYEKLI